jgi:hypothetical protein
VEPVRLAAAARLARRHGRIHARFVSRGFLLIGMEAEGLGQKF